MRRGMAPQRRAGDFMPPPKVVFSRSGLRRAGSYRSLSRFRQIATSHGRVRRAASQLRGGRRSPSAHATRRRRLRDCTYGYTRARQRMPAGQVLWGIEPFKVWIEGERPLGALDEANEKADSRRLVEAPRARPMSRSRCTGSSRTARSSPEAPDPRSKTGRRGTADLQVFSLQGRGQKS